MCILSVMVNVLAQRCNKEYEYLEINPMFWGLLLQKRPQDCSLKSTTSKATLCCKILVVEQAASDLSNKLKPGASTKEGRSAPSCAADYYVIGHQKHTYLQPTFCLCTLLVYYFKTIKQAYLLGIHAKSTNVFVSKKIDCLFFADSIAIFREMKLENRYFPVQQFVRRN